MSCVPRNLFVAWQIGLLIAREKQRKDVVNEIRGENGTDSFRPVRTKTDSDYLRSDFLGNFRIRNEFGFFFVGNGNEYGRHAIRRIRIRIRIIRIRPSPDIRISAQKKWILAQKRKGDFN